MKNFIWKALTVYLPKILKIFLWVALIVILLLIPLVIYAGIFELEFKMSMFSIFNEKDITLNFDHINVENRKERLDKSYVFPQPMYHSYMGEKCPAQIWLDEERDFLESMERWQERNSQKIKSLDEKIAALKKTKSDLEQTPKGPKGDADIKFQIKWVDFDISEFEAEKSVLEGQSESSRKLIASKKKHIELLDELVKNCRW